MRYTISISFNICILNTYGYLINGYGLTWSSGLGIQSMCLLQIEDEPPENHGGGFFDSQDFGKARLKAGAALKSLVLMSIQVTALFSALNFPSSPLHFRCQKLTPFGGFCERCVGLAYADAAETPRHRRHGSRRTKNFLAPKNIDRRIVGDMSLLLSLRSKSLYLHVIHVNVCNYSKWAWWFMMQCKLYYY